MKKLKIIILEVSAIFLFTIIFLLNKSNNDNIPSQRNSVSVNKKEEVQGLKLNEKTEASKNVGIGHEIEHYKKTGNESYVEIKQYRHQGEQGFDPKMLCGQVDNENGLYRNDFYSKIDMNSLKKQLKSADPDSPVNTADQFQNVIDYALGIDFPEYKRKTIYDAQIEMLYRKDALDEKLKNGADNLYIGRVNDYFETYLTKVATVLTDEEFEKLFQISKDEIQGAFVLMVNNATAN